MVQAIIAALVMAPQTSPLDRRNLVADAKTAAAVAEAILVPIYRKENIDMQKPLVATLRDGLWHVRGTMPKTSVGGVAEIVIKAKDCQVLRISHGK